MFPMRSWFELWKLLSSTCLPGSSQTPVCNPCAAPPNALRRAVPNPLTRSPSFEPKTSPKPSPAPHPPIQDIHRQDDGYTEPQEEPAEERSKKPRKRIQTGQTTTAAVFRAQECRPFERDPVVVSRFRDTRTPAEAISSSGSRKGCRSPDHTPPCNSTTSGIPHIHQETQPDADVVGAARTRDLHWQALRLGMEGRGSRREGPGGGGANLEELQWRRHRGRNQPRAEGYPEDAGREYERRQNHEWAARCEPAEQLDTGAD